LIVVAIMAGILLVVQSYSLLRGVALGDLGSPLVRLLLLVFANLVLTSILVSVGLLYLWGQLSRNLPDLSGWHLESPASEFVSGDETSDYTLDDYINQEQRAFDELDDLMRHKWRNSSTGAYCRYDVNSICNPAKHFDHNWNQSRIKTAENPIGGALLLHGLSDCPYSLRTIGERLHTEGYTVVWLRLPGHGTSPHALANVSWKDWTAAVRVAARGLRAMLPDGLPIILGGYSNGGALSVHYALSSLEDESLPFADAVLLFSPMIGINPLARVTRLYHTVGLLSNQQKAAWSNVDAEIDPFKFSSWPMNGNVQAWRMTKAIRKKLDRLKKSGRMALYPPVLAMQSVVDSTVIAEKLISVLFDRLETKESELFLFDINREQWLANLINPSFEEPIRKRLRRTDLPFTLSVLSNSKTDSSKVCVQSREGDQWTEKDTEFQWPEGMASLSHVAVPFSMDDPVYGRKRGDSEEKISLGELSLLAEPSSLMIASSLFLRCRHNPFYEFMEEYLVDWLREIVTSKQ
jgi:alpha-beta hydrolase superfamily lysophospholipase